jgi:hypothetical protein
LAARAKLGLSAMADLAYMTCMSVLLDQAIARLQALPAHRQEEAAEAVIAVLSRLDGTDEALSETELVEIDRRLARGPNYATDQEVDEAFGGPLP